MKQMIKAIETEYGGYKFRSRLEARWAIYFDCVGLVWEYEPEGYDLPDGRRYLPDFKITDINGDIVFYEIKATAGADDGKLLELLKALNPGNRYHHDKKPYYWGSVLSGDPYSYIIENKRYPCPRCLQFEADYVDFGAMMSYCFNCDQNTPCGGENPAENHFGFDVYPYKGDIHFFDKYNFRKYKTLVETACENARKARFEYGQTPERYTHWFSDVWKREDEIYNGLVESFNSGELKDFTTRSLLSHIRRTSPDLSQSEFEFILGAAIKFVYTGCFDQYIKTPDENDIINAYRNAVRITKEDGGE